MKDQLDDWELGLIVQARRLDDPTVIEADAADAYRDHRELIDAADGVEVPVVVERDDAQQFEQTADLREAAADVDDPKVVEASEWDATQEACDAVEALLSDALKEQNGLRDEVVDAMSAKDMVNQFRDDDDELSVDALAQTPATGGDPDADADGGDDDPPELSSEDKRAIEQKLDKAELMSGRADGYAEDLRAEAASIAGVDDVSDIDLEVL